MEWTIEWMMEFLCTADGTISNYALASFVLPHIQIWEERL